MQPTGESDRHGRPLYACANAPCPARGVLPHGKDPATWRMHGFGDNCRGGGLRLGDRLAWLLGKVGLTKQRWARLWGREECGCDQRQDRLNDLTNPRWWLRQIHAAASTAVKLAAPILRRLP